MKAELTQSAAGWPAGHIYPGLHSHEKPSVAMNQERQVMALISVRQERITRFVAWLEPRMQAVPRAMSIWRALVATDRLIATAVPQGRRNVIKSAYYHYQLHALIGAYNFMSHAFAMSPRPRFAVVAVYLDHRLHAQSHPTITFHDTPGTHVIWLTCGVTGCAYYFPPMSIWCQCLYQCEEVNTFA